MALEIRFRYYPVGYQLGGNWNETTTATASTLFADAKDWNTGAATGVTIAASTALTGINPQGNAVTSPDAGIAGRFFECFGYRNATHTLALSGLANGSYTIRLAGNGGGTAARDTDYTVNGVGPTRYDNLPAGDSAGETATAPISIDFAVSDGTATINAAVVSTYAYVNGFILTASGASAVAGISRHYARMRCG